MNREAELLAAILDEPHSEDRWWILADWLEEHDDPRRAELLRLHRRLLQTCCTPNEHSERAGWQARLVALLGVGVRPCVPQRTVELAPDALAAGSPGVEMTFSFIPPGTFLMGSPPNEKRRYINETQHRATLTKGFFLGVHLVTQEQWQRVLGSNPSRFTGTANLPVDSVTWDECQEFCRKLSERDGKPYRLATEAEWEYACRAGTTTPFSFGATLSSEQANYDARQTYGKGKVGQYREKTTPVGSFSANAWGLTDTHGNLWEWCQDWYGTYATGDLKDPQGSNHGDARVLRGGSWYSYPQFCRAAYRNWITPDGRSYSVGCRLAFPLD